MLFKNAFIYRITSKFELSSEALESHLESQTFKPTSGIRPSSFGWVAPLEGIDGSLIHEVAGSILLCARREDKIVPGSALADVMSEKITRIEQLEGRPLRAREKQRLKDDSLAELLPRALPRSKNIQAYLTPADNLLVINTSSAAEAELFINCLRDSLGSFSVVPPQLKAKPTDAFTQWLKSRKLPDDFTLGDACDLFDIEDGSMVSCRKQDLDTSEVRSHIDAGKRCTKLNLRWHGDLRVTVDKDATLRQIKLESSDDEGDEDADPVAMLDAAFASMTLEFARFIPALFTALGGESRD